MSLYDQREKALIEDLMALGFWKDHNRKYVYFREKLGMFERRKFLAAIKKFENLTGRRVFWSNIGNMVEINIRPGYKPSPVFRKDDSIDYDPIDAEISKWMKK